MADLGRDDPDLLIVARQPRRCPRCGATTMAIVQYGLPAMTTALRRNLDEGRVVLGGCLPMARTWACVGCRQGFRRPAPAWRREAVADGAGGKGDAPNLRRG